MLKRTLGMLMLVVPVVACSAADDASVPEADEATSSVEQPVVNGWIGPVSEESWKQSATCGSPGVGATQAWCSGSYCDDMYLFCGSVPQGFATNGVDRGWTIYVSEEGGGPAALCPSGAIVDGIRATGSYADNVSVHCTGASFPSQGTNCKWTPWFSEEQGGQTFTGPGLRSAVALGVRCSGSYCDNMSYFVCEPKCRTNADCGSDFCVNGVCTIG